ncbi:MAG: hypothetical protein KF744_04945 [Taibaiella sp.]|nr:hypothetical protein [Taibaiella sp.]
MKKKLSGKEKRQLRIKPTTIEKIECDNWGNAAPYPSHLVTTIYALRKKDLNTFTTEDLRIVIGQNQSLPILMPMALAVLRDNILAEGDLYPGDLLKSVLTVDAGFWNTHPDVKEEIMLIIENGRDTILSSEDIGGKIANEILSAYESLKCI